MAKKVRSGKKPTSPAKPAADTSAADLPRAQVARVPVRKDPRRWIYVGFDLVFTIGYVYAFSTLLYNRFGWARSIFYLLPLCTLAMAIGTASARRWGWWATVAGATGMLLWTVGFLLLLLKTAAFLAGVYGAFGAMAANMVRLSSLFVIQLVAMLAALQLKWAMTRAGRAAFGLAPLWPRKP